MNIQEQLDPIEKLDEAISHSRKAGKITMDSAVAASDVSKCLKAIAQSKVRREVAAQLLLLAERLRLEDNFLKSLEESVAAIDHIEAVRDELSRPKTPGKLVLLQGGVR